MIEPVQTCFTQYGLQHAISVCARVYSSCWCLCTPNVDQTEKKNPDHIYEVPIQYRQVEHGGTPWCHQFQVSKANSQVQESNNYMHSMKSCSQVELTSKYRVTKCKLSSAILQILVKTKQPSKTNCIGQHVSRFSIISIIQRVFSVVLTKVRLSQQYSVQSRSTSPVNRNNSYWRPTHTNSYGWHQSLMQESPQQTNKEHCFANNKQNHSQKQSIFNFGSMASIQSFTNNITPPQRLCVGQKNQLGQQYGSTSSIFVEIQNQTQCQSKHTKTCKLRPRARIQQMKWLVWNTRTRTLERFNLVKVTSLLGVQFVLKKFKHKKKNKKSSFLFLLQFPDITTRSPPLRSQFQSSLPTLNSYTNPTARTTRKKTNPVNP